MAQAPLLDAANGATAAQVLTGKTFWGLLGGGWGTLTGTMPNNGTVNITPSTSALRVAHTTSGPSVVDSEKI